MNLSFYVQPEKSTSPDSSVWYTNHVLSREDIAKVLNRIEMVKEINIAKFLNDSE